MSNLGACATAVEKQPQVRAEMSKQVNCLDELHTAIAALGGRIETITQPRPDVPPMNDEKSEIYVPLAQELRDSNLRLIEMTGTIKCLIANIEL